MAGQPSQKEVKDFGSKMKNSRTRGYMWGSVAPGASVAETRQINSNLYPYKPLPQDDFDTEWQIRQQITHQDADMVSAKRPLPWTEREIQYLKDKRDAEEFAAYTDWIAHKFPLNDPANRDLLKKIVPSYFATRKQNLREQIALQAKYADLRLFGPENEQDLQLIYEVETGRVKIPTGPFHDPVKWMENEYGIAANANDVAAYMRSVAVGNEKVYEAGLFSPFRILSYANAPSAPNALNMADAWGDDRVKALGPFGARQPYDYNYGNVYRGQDLGRTNRFALNYENPDKHAVVAALPGVGERVRFENYAAQFGGNYPGTGVPGAAILGGNDVYGLANARGFAAPP